MLIEHQIELGEDSLEEEDKYLLEINLEDLESTSGKAQTYWLLAIQAAKEANALRGEAGEASARLPQESAEV